jgi:hypothetical protein
MALVSEFTDFIPKKYKDTKNQSYKGLIISYLLTFFANHFCLITDQSNLLDAVVL